MDHLPPEIWSQIFRMVCTDNGRTGRSLSLVSQFFNECSKPYKLQSVTVLGPKQLLCFAMLIESTPPSLRHVKRIFLSSKSFQKLEPEFENLTNDSMYAMVLDILGKRILDAIAPSVRVLHMFFMASGRSPYTLSPVSLPMLEELVIHGPLGMSPGTDVRFISLKRLTLTFLDDGGASITYSPHTPSPNALDGVLKQAPHLAHLSLRATESYGWMIVCKWLSTTRQGLMPLPNYVGNIYIHSCLPAFFRVHEENLPRLDNRIVFLPRWNEEGITLLTAMVMWAANISHN